MSCAASELPKALSMDADEFKSIYSFQKPDHDDLVVLSCRTNRRAKWAAALCSEAGWKRWGAGCIAHFLATPVRLYLRPFMQHRRFDKLFGSVTAGANKNIGPEPWLMLLRTIEFRDKQWIIFLCLQKHWLFF